MARALSACGAVTTVCGAALLQLSVHAPVLALAFTPRQPVALAWSAAHGPARAPAAAVRGAAAASLDCSGSRGEQNGGVPRGGRPHLRGGRAWRVRACTSARVLGEDRQAEMRAHRGGWSGSRKSSVGSPAKVVGTLEAVSENQTARSEAPEKVDFRLEQLGLCMARRRARHPRRRAGPRLGNPPDLGGHVCPPTAGGRALHAGEIEQTTLIPVGRAGSAGCPRPAVRPGSTHHSRCRAGVTGEDVVH